MERPTPKAIDQQLSKCERGLQTPSPTFPSELALPPPTPSMSDESRSLPVDLGLANSIAAMDLDPQTALHVTRLKPSNSGRIDGPNPSSLSFDDEPPSRSDVFHTSIDINTANNTTTVTTNGRRNTPHMSVNIDGVGQEHALARPIPRGAVGPSPTKASAGNGSITRVSIDGGEGGGACVAITMQPSITAHGSSSASDHGSDSSFASSATSSSSASDHASTGSYDSCFPPLIPIVPVARRPRAASATTTTSNGIGSIIIPASSPNETQPMPPSVLDSAMHDHRYQQIPPSVLGSNSLRATGASVEPPSTARVATGRRTQSLDSGCGAYGSAREIRRGSTWAERYRSHSRELTPLEPSGYFMPQSAPGALDAIDTGIWF